MATTSYSTILRDWANLAQLDYDTLLADDAETFRTSFNRWVRKIHNYTDWPESITIEEWDNGTDTNEFPVSLGTNLEEVLGVWDKDPRTDRTAKPINYDVDDENVYLLDSADRSSIWAKYSTNPGNVAFGGASVTIPKRYHDYVLYGCLSDWYGPTDDAKAERYRTQADEILLDEIESLKRRSRRQSRPMVSAYPNGNAY